MSSRNAVSAAEEKTSSASDNNLPNHRAILRTVIGIAVVAICLFAGWLGFNGVLQILLWGITAATGFAAAIIAWNALVPSEQTSFRPHLLVTAVALAAVSFFTYRSLASALKPNLLAIETTQSSLNVPQPVNRPAPRVPSKEAVATRESWQRARGILTSLDGTGNRGQQQTLPDPIKQLQHAGDRFASAARELSKLPVQDVDLELSTWVARYIRWLDRGKNYLYRMKEICTDRQRLERHAKSSDAFVESVIRGLAGDPLGKFRETSELNRQLGTDYRDAQRELQALAEAYSDLRGEAHRLRASLGAKYEIDLPAIE